MILDSSSFVPSFSDKKLLEQQLNIMHTIKDQLAAINRTNDGGSGRGGGGNAHKNNGGNNRRKPSIKTMNIDVIKKKLQRQAIMLLNMRHADNHEENFRNLINNIDKLAASAASN